MPKPTAYLTAGNILPPSTLHEQNASWNWTTLFSPRKPFSFAVFGSLRTKGIRVTSKWWTIIFRCEAILGIFLSLLPSYMDVSIMQSRCCWLLFNAVLSEMEGVKLKSGWKERWTGCSKHREHEDQRQIQQQHQAPVLTVVTLLSPKLTPSHLSYRGAKGHILAWVKSWMYSF